MKAHKISTLNMQFSIQAKIVNTELHSNIVGLKREFSIAWGAFFKYDTIDSVNGVICILLPDFVSFATLIKSICLKRILPGTSKLG
jgi:hypothetical protein